jgi:alpha-tubulin suppressor-like RCC1 family protein
MRFHMRALFVLGAGALLVPLFSPRQGTHHSRRVGTALASASTTITRGQGAPLRFTSVSAGGGHSCGLTATGAAYCWGQNEHGQLGDSSTVDRPAPVPVAGGISFRLITAGGRHTCGIATDDSPYCWGGNDYGQLGIGRTSDRAYPTKVEYRAAGMGTFRAWVMSAGAQHTCALILHRERQGEAFCWGRNSHGQLGTRGEIGTTRDASSPAPTFGGARYTSVAAGSEHTCAVSREGIVYCWGANARGQLGNASRTDSPVRFPVRKRGRETFASVTVGASHSCALTSEEEAYCWGDNSAGQVGTGKRGYSMTPTPLGGSLRFTVLSAGGDATCGVRRDGAVSCWGSNATGQFGTGATPGSRTPVAAAPGLTLTAISLGRAHACGLQADGSAYCWGQLESGVGAGSSSPRRVAGQL